MADDTIDIIEPFDFHPCNSPRGMLYYDLQDLTSDQQIELNKFKRNSVRENEKYLASHPEIRALISLISRYVFLNRPRTDLPEFIGRFFLRPKLDIEKEVAEYISSRDPHVYEGDSAVGLNSEYKKEKVSTPEPLVEEEDYHNVPKELLDEIVEKAIAQLEARDWRSFNADEKAVIVKSVISDIINKVLEDRERVLSYLYQSELDGLNYESTTVTLDNLTTASEVSSTASSDSNTDVKNVTEIQIAEKSVEIEQDPSEATDTFISSREMLDLSEEQSEENFELAQDVEQPPEITEQPAEVVEQPLEIVEEPPAGEVPEEIEAPAEDAT